MECIFIRHVSAAGQHDNIVGNIVQTTLMKPTVMMQKPCRHISAACKNTFMQELNECELELYNLFDGSMEYLRSPFRICRDLAFYNEGKTDTGKFFLGCRDLGTRLGINHKTASKYLLELVNYEIIKMVSAGRMIKRQASEYEWMLSS